MCPYFQKSQVRICRASPGIKVPTVAEQVRYCLTDNHQSCIFHRMYEETLEEVYQRAVSYGM